MKKFSTNRINLLLIVILVFGAGLRFWHLGTAKFWADEDMGVASQYRSVREIIVERIERSQFINIEPPGYHILNKVAQVFAPDPDDAFNSWLGRFGLRLISALCGILSIYIMFLLGKIFIDKTYAWIPAALLSFSFYGVFYSQENRPYSLVVMLTLLSTWLFIEAFFKRRRRLAIPYSFSVAAICYMHYTAILTPMVHAAAFGAAWLLRLKTPFDEYESTRIDRWDVSAFFLAGVGALILFSPWLPHSFSMAVKPTEYFHSAKGPSLHLSYIHFILAVSTYAHFGCGGFLSIFTYGLLAPIGLIGIRRNNSSLAALGACFYIVPTLFVLLNSYSIYLQPRYLIIVFPIHQLLAGAGIVEIARFASKQLGRLRRLKFQRMKIFTYLIGAIVAFLFFMNLIPLRYYYANQIKCSSENFAEVQFCEQYLQHMVSALEKNP